MLPDVGRARFSGNLSTRNAYWREYSSFIEQARTYLRAARVIGNHSSALMLYYAAMNLAKAELLVHDQSIPIGHKWTHGLTHKTDGSSPALRDSVTSLPDGVFARLYSKRTGVELGKHTFSMTSVLRNIPEITTQMVAAGFNDPSVAQAKMALCTDGNEAWSLIAFWGDEISINRATESQLKKTHREVAANSASSAGLEIRSDYLEYFRFYESVSAVPHGGTSGRSRQEARVLVAEQLRLLLPFIERNVSGDPDAWFTPSTSAARFVPLPPSLARYVAFFYGSSLVRYRPSKLNPSTDPKASYLFDALCRESALPMMLDALVGIRGHTVGFSARPAYAT